ncbi:MAG TPA: SpoIIE family protein phosphatase [Pyrinomonadaceae bacterium]
MNDPRPYRLQERIKLVPERKTPFFSLQHVTVFVRDLDRSIRFYIDQLGFTHAYDVRADPDYRWTAVAPPDGTAVLALIPADPNSEEYKLIGQHTNVAFLTEDITTTFNEWSERQVRFQHPPQRPIWGGLFTVFEDIDGNSFGLVGFDEVTRQIESQKRELAAKLELERRAAYEMDIAKQVQARLFPQTQPALRTLDYSGVCIQARQVGGDYYDFLDLGEQRVGLVVGDVSGKGIAAALMMAGLQASLRSQSAIAADQPQTLLRLANRLFYENTNDNSYATLFFAEYDDRSQRLRYSNCGHLTPILLRSGERVGALESTSTVLGLFDDLESRIGEVQLHSGDVFLIYTDGITEALNESGEEFGTERLLSTLRRSSDLPAKKLLEMVIDEVQKFSSNEQQRDDMTLIVAKCFG